MGRKETTQSEVNRFKVVRANILDLLADVKEAEKWSRNKLCSEAGVSEPGLRAFINGKAATVTMPTLDALAGVREMVGTDLFTPNVFRKRRGPTYIRDVQRALVALAGGDEIELQLWIQDEPRYVVILDRANMSALARGARIVLGEEKATPGERR